MTSHRCHRDAWCAHWEADPSNGQRVGAAIVADHGLCEPCTRQVARALRELPRDYTELELALAGVNRLYREPVAGTPDSQVPLRLDAEALQTAMVHESLCWAETVADTQGIVIDTQAARDSRPGVVLSRCCALLGVSVPVLLSQRGVEHLGWVYGVATVLTRDGLDGAVTFIDLHQQARSLLGLTRYTNRLTAPCPRCECQDLTRADGSETIVCGTCDRRYTWDEYTKLCGVYADWHERHGALIA